MSTDRPKRESMSIEEVTISNIWEIAAIVEVLVVSEVCARQLRTSTAGARCERGKAGLVG